MLLPSSQQSPSKCPSICKAISLTSAFSAFVSGCVFLTIDQGIDNVPDNQRFIDMLAGGGLLCTALACLCLAIKPSSEKEEESKTTIRYTPPPYSELEESRSQIHGVSNSV